MPEECAAVSIRDRGFLYGDGLFETVRAYHGKLFLWQEHAARFFGGCEALEIASPLSPRELRLAALEILRRNDLDDAVIRISLSRGPGSRGYSPAPADHPALAIVPFPSPVRRDSLRVITSRHRLPVCDPLAAIKHASKLPQVMARAEADKAGADEALFLDASGNLLEATAANLFWIRKKTVFTPPPGGILPGITRAVVLELCTKLRWLFREESAALPALMNAEGVFLTSTGLEIVSVTQIDGTSVPQSPLVRQLQREFGRRIERAEAAR